jgi:hypothetical protein
MKKCGRYKHRKLNNALGEKIRQTWKWKIGHFTNGDQSGMSTQIFQKIQQTLSPVKSMEEITYIVYKKQN